MGSPTRPLVIIPTYNERENVARLVPAVLEADDRIHVLVVDDDSPDGTAQAVATLGRADARQRVFVERRTAKLGLGSAYVHGLEWGLANGYDFMIQMDADWSHDPRYLPRMLRLAGQADFVVGSRYVTGGRTVHWGAARKLLSRVASVYARTVLGIDIADLTGGFNGWSREVLQGISLESLRSDGYSFQIELKYRAHQSGFRHIEFPILFSERRAGRSKMSFPIALEACWRVWQLRLNGPAAGPPVAPGGARGIRQGRA